MNPPGETSFGGTGGRFPSTRWSDILDARDRKSPAYREAINHLCRLYWKPLFAHVRRLRGIGAEEAMDVTQEFLCELIQGTLLERYSRDRGSFRAYLRGAIQLFLMELHQRAAALKRGGGRKILSLDDVSMRTAEDLPDFPSLTPEKAYDVHWARSVVDHALGDLKDELNRGGKEAYLRVFDRCQLNPSQDHPVSHGELARELGIRESDVANYLAHCRKRLRSLIRDRIRDYVTDESEIDGELVQIFALLAEGGG